MDKGKTLQFILATKEVAEQNHSIWLDHGTKMFGGGRQARLAAGAASKGKADTDSTDALTVDKSSISVPCMPRAEDAGRASQLLQQLRGAMEFQDDEKPNYSGISGHSHRYRRASTREAPISYANNGTRRHHSSDIVGSSQAPVDVTSFGSGSHALSTTPHHSHTTGSGRSTSNSQVHFGMDNHAANRSPGPMIPHDDSVRSRRRSVASCGSSSSQIPLEDVMSHAQERSIPRLSGGKARRASCLSRTNTATLAMLDASQLLLDASPQDVGSDEVMSMSMLPEDQAQAKEGALGDMRRPRYVRGQNGSPFTVDNGGSGAGGNGRSEKKLVASLGGYVAASVAVRAQVDRVGGGSGSVSSPQMERVGSFGSSKNVILHQVTSSLGSFTKKSGNRVVPEQSTSHGIREKEASPAAVPSMRDDMLGGWMDFRIADSSSQGTAHLGDDVYSYGDLLDRDCEVTEVEDFDEMQAAHTAARLKRAPSSKHIGSSGQSHTAAPPSLMRTKSITRSASHIVTSQPHRALSTVGGGKHKDEGLVGKLKTLLFKKIGV